ncbi:LacI family DNA-binding transcriptional regulator [Trichococcus palustris]|nr:LacI family DNA-binding transcriptional regulator [Trichococcus palustris]
MENISMKDIAELSGVSIATVSRVLNNNGRFSEETKEKVLKVIEETGYQINYSAKTLRMNKSFSIGILVPDITNLFFANVVEQIEEILFDKGYSTIICNTARDAKKEKAYLSVLVSKLIDGLIIISGADDFEFEHQSAKKEIPYVCIDREPKDKDRTIFISSNHYQGAFEATENLIANGVKHPAIVLHKKSSSSSKERFSGFKDALKKNNIDFSNEENTLFFHTNKQENKTLLKNFVNDHPDTDGLFTVNDNIGLDIILFLKELNIDVPKDIKIIGFDNVPTCEYSNPTLSSIKQDTEKIAKKAVSSLIKLIDGQTEDKGKIYLLPVQLIERESSKLQ